MLEVNSFPLPDKYKEKLLNDLVELQGVKIYINKGSKHSRILSLYTVMYHNTTKHKLGDILSLYN